jgi:hypothetical protein
MRKSRSKNKTVFVSHVSEDASVAGRLKRAIARDFLGLVTPFVSSDTSSVAAGEDWLVAIDTALKESSLLVVLCSARSIRRPWINFEAGAAWVRGIPLVPACHDGFTPRDLPIPLSLRQGILLGDPNGLRNLYGRIARALECQVPERSYDSLAKELVPAVVPTPALEPDADLVRDRVIRGRLLTSLKDQRFNWRSLSRLAAEAGISEEAAADLLRADNSVRFGQGRSHTILVGLRSRVGE